MRRTKNVLTAPWASPVASTATVVRPRRLPGTRRTTILEGVLQVGFQQTSQERLERGVVGNRSQCERSAQLSVFAQTNFGFAEGPVLVAHEAQDSQQLRLVALDVAQVMPPYRTCFSKRQFSPCAKRPKPTSASSEFRQR